VTSGGANVGIVVIGETPYAEGMGDRTDLMGMTVAKAIVLKIKNFSPVRRGLFCNRGRSNASINTDGQQYRWPKVIDEGSGEFTCSPGDRYCGAALFSLLRRT
jgi:hypothetical protein